jgi:PPOX class probable FMN-dependent enzyme
MIQTSERRRITDLATLRALVGTPGERAVRKQLAALDQHCRAFIAQSPFVLLGTSGPDGRCDVSPKGDRPGFVLTLDETTLVIPDRPGNRRLDSLQNILANPHVGLLFLIPGMDETLRVNGTAELVQDEDLLDRLAVDGKRPLLSIVVHIEETFLHCARSFLRAQLWNPEQFMPREQLPSLARMIIDQISPPGDQERAVHDAERAIDESYRCLYEVSPRHRADGEPVRRARRVRRGRGRPRQLLALRPGERGVDAHHADAGLYRLRLSVPPGQQRRRDRLLAVPDQRQRWTLRRLRALDQWPEPRHQRAVLGCI